MMLEKLSTELRDAIGAANENFTNTLGFCDAAGMAQLYTRNGQIMAPNTDTVTGREAIRAYWEAILNRGGNYIRLELVELDECEDTAIEILNYTLLNGIGQTLDRGKCIFIWKREEGQWKLHRDMYNSSLPLPDTS